MTIPQDPNQRWSLDFVSDTLVDGRRFRILCVIDDFSREYLATGVDNSSRVIALPWSLMPSQNAVAIPCWWVATTAPNSPPMRG